MADFLDGGVALTYGGAVGSGAAPGHYMLYANATLDLYAQLVSQIRIEHRTNFGSEFQSPTVTTPRPWNILDFARMAGVAGLNDGTLQSGSTAFSAGSRLIENQTFKEVFDDVASFQVATIGFDSLDRFFSIPLIPIPAGGEAFVFRDGINCRNVTFDPIAGLERRVWRVRVKAGATRKSALAKIVPDAIREVLSKDGWLTDFTATCQAIKDSDPYAEEAEVQIQGNEFPDSTAMLNWALRFFKIYGARPYPVTLEVPFSREAMALKLVDRVTFYSDRFGADVGRTCFIWSIDQQLKTRTIRFGLVGFSDYPMSTGDIVLTMNDASQGSGGNGGGTGATGRGESAPQEESFVIACSDETTALTAGTAKRTFFVPYEFFLLEVQAALVVAQTSGSIFTVDINENGASILSTKLTIDNTESTSITAAAPPVISDPTLAKGAKITIDIDQIGDGTAKGLIVTLVGYQL